MMNVVVTTSDSALVQKAKSLAELLRLEYCDYADQSSSLRLVLTAERLELHSNQKPKTNPIYVDFLAGKLAHRHQFGGGRGQLIARACGLRKLKNPTVVDVTAGLGQDAFVLATLGCQVTMIERSPILAALLRDGLERARVATWFNELQLNFIEMDSLQYLNELKTSVDVIYLDPMFPKKTKSALVKKEMRILRQLVGEDLDAAQLLARARQIAKHRVVVKRARLAPTLDDTKPDLVYSGKSCRFDVYTQRG